MASTNLLISGKMRSGKTYTTREIIERLEKLGYKVKHLSLARWLKLLLARGFDRHDRPAMQYMGTEVMRVFAGDYFGTEDFWVNLMLADMEDWKDDYDVFICDDCRFPGEVNRLREVDFKVVRLATTRELQLSRGNEGAKATVNLDHPSELALDAHENIGFFDLETNPTDSISEMVDKVFATLLKDIPPPAPRTEMEALALKVDSKWRSEFLQFVNAGEAGQEFLDYIDTNEEIQAVLDEAFKIITVGVDQVVAELQEKREGNDMTKSAHTRRYDSNDRPNMATGDGLG